MALKKEEALKTITDGLAWVVAQAQMRCPIHLLDSNTLLHELFRRLLNEMHDLQLVATDRIQSNFPAIDLGDEVKKRSFQVTTEKKKAKIQATLNTFDRHGLAKQFGKLQVIVIGDRQKSYGGLKVPSGMPFIWGDDIIDMPRLIKQIEALPTEKLERIAIIVRAEIRFPNAREPHDWKAFQGSGISIRTYSLPLPVRPGSDEVDPKIWKGVKDELHQWLALAFGHTCITTPFDNFVYILSVERAKQPPGQGFALYELTLVCHITEFAWAFQEWSQFFLERKKEWKAGSRVTGFSGEQLLRGGSLLGELVPHRIRRMPPTEISLLPLVDRAKPYDRRVTTSTLLHMMSGALTSHLLILDDAEKCPDRKKLLSIAERMSRTGRFSWDDIQLKRDDPESWEHAPH